MRLPCSDNAQGKAPIAIYRLPNLSYAIRPLMAGSCVRILRILSRVFLSPLFSLYFRSADFIHSVSSIALASKSVTSVVLVLLIDSWNTFVADSRARSCWILMATSESSKASLLIARNDGILCGGVPSLAVSSRSWNLWRRTRSNAFTSWPPHGSVL